MLFNSFHFIFLYLPVTLVLFFGLSRLSFKYAGAWLGIASLIFYGVWDYRYLPLLLSSIVFNYWIARAIDGAAGGSTRKGLLIFSITANLLLLGYYKYANFFASSLSFLGVDDDIDLAVVLPIGISFFTFTQIAYLVDNFQGKVRDYNFMHYLLFVTYFPHLSWKTKLAARRAKSGKFSMPPRRARAGRVPGGRRLYLRP